MHCQIVELRLSTTKPLREKVCRAVCKFPGHAVTLRDLQKHIKGALVDNIKCEYIVQ